MHIKEKKIMTLKQNLTQFFLILSLLIIDTASLFAQDTSSSDFCQIAALTGGACVKITKPEDGEDDPTISCSAFNIIIGTIRPSITSISPLKMPLDSTADLLITAPNANFNSSSTVRIEGSNIVINEINVLSATQIKANVTVPSTAAREFYDVFVDTTLGTETETAEGRCALEVIEKSEDVQILSINPSQIAQGSTADMEIYGNNIDFTAGVPVVDFGDTRITTTQLNVHNSTHLTATVNVDASAPTGFYQVTVTADGKVARDIEPGGAFLVLSSDFKIPTIDSLTPKQVQQGKTVENLNIVGDETGFNSSSSLSFSGEGITATEIEVKNATEILATVEIAQDAAPGSRDVFVTTGTETATGLKLFEIQLNEGPTDINLSNTVINESEPNETVIGTFDTTDPDDETHVYDLENDAGGRFQVVGHELQIADSTLLTANHLVSHPIQVTSTDNGGKSISANFTINVNYAPKDITLSNTTAIERSGVGIIGALSINDPNLNTPNSDDSHTYILANNADGLFELSDNQLRVANSDLLVKGEYPIRIKVTDSTDLSFEKDFTITVTDDPKPVDITLSNPIAGFNSPAGTAIGELSTIDPTPNDSHNYEVIENANGLFGISGNSLIANQKLSEVGEYPINVRSTDTDGLQVDKNFTITVKRMNLSNNTIFVDSKTGTKIGQFSTTMAFGNQPHTYLLKDDKGGLFWINDNDDLIVANASLLEIDQYDITVRSTDEDGLSFEKDFTIIVTDDPKPIDITLSNATAVLNSPYYTLIGELSTVDPTPNDTHDYELVDDANGRFKIDGIKLVANQTLSEVDEYEITVRSTDEDDLSIEKDLTITVTDAPKPIDIKLSSTTIVSGSPSGTLIGELSTIDPTPNDTHSYEVIDDANGLFNISGNQLITNKELSRTGEYRLIVRSTDESGLFVEKDFTITVEPTTETEEEDEDKDEETEETGETEDSTNSQDTTTTGGDTEDSTNAQNETTTTGGDTEDSTNAQNETTTTGGETGESIETDTEGEITTSTDEEDDEDTTSSESGDTTADDTSGTNSSTVPYDDTLDIGTKPIVVQQDKASLQFADDIFVVDEYATLSTTLTDQQVLGHLIEIPVERIANTDGTVTVNYEVKDAKSGIDFSYLSSNRLLTWMDGDSEDKTISLFVVKKDEQTRWLNIHLFNPKGKAILGTPSETWLIKQGKFCQPAPDSFLQPAEQEITLTVGGPAKQLTFTSGQQEGPELIQTPDTQIVSFEKPIFRASGTLLTLAPVKEGQTYLVLGDCASFALVNITVEPDPNTPVQESEVLQESESPIVIETDEKDITLKLDEGPLTLKITGGQDIDEQHQREITEQPDENIVTLDTIFPREGGFILTLTPIAIGETHLVISDGFNEETITIEVIPPRCTDDPELALRSEETNIILEIGQEASFWNIMGGQGEITLTSQQDDIAMAQLLFTEDDDMLLKLTPQQVGKTTLRVNDECDSQAEITVTVASQCDTLNYDEAALPLTVESENLILVAGNEGEKQEPHFITITGGQGDIEFTQNNEVVMVKLFSDEEEQLLRVIPQQAGETTLSINDCLTQTEIAITILPEQPNALGVDAMGESVATTAYFAVESNTRQNGEEAWLIHTDSVVMGLNIMIDPAHIGQAVSLIRVMIHQPSGQLFMQNGETWQIWDGQLTSLVAAGRESALSDNIMNTLTLPLDSLPLEPFEGELLLYLGYRLGDGTIIFNGKNPPRFNIASQGQMIRQGQDKDKTSALFTGELSTDTGRTGHHLILSSTETVSANFTIQIDEAHIGQPANLIIAAAHPEWGIFSMQDEANWQVWDGIDIASLKAIEYYDNLPSTLTIDKTLVSHIPAKAFAGEWAIYVGYRLEVLDNLAPEKELNLGEVFSFDDLNLRQRQNQEEGVIIFNGSTPLRLSVQY
jgi:hypothetical protein